MEHDIDNMHLHDLYDLFEEKTKEFLKLLEDRKADGYKIPDLKLLIDKIQAEISSRKYHINGKEISHGLTFFL